MKRIIIYITLLLILTTILAGCYYDEVEPKPEEPLPTNVSLKEDLVPIFNANCITSGCHDQAGSHDPSLVQSKVYNALLLGNYVNVQQPEKSILYLQVKNGDMPPTGPLTTKEQNLILVWIKEGAKDN